MVFKSFGEGLEERYTGIFKLARFDITKNQGFAKQFGILSTPSYLVFNDGDQVKTFFGDRVDRNIIEDYIRSLQD